MTTIVEESPPPPPRKSRRSKPKTDQVACAGSLPLFRRRSLNVELWEGFTITISGLWMTKPRWASRPESSPGSGWHPWRFGFIVVAIRVDW